MYREFNIINEIIPNKTYQIRRTISLRPHCWYKLNIQKAPTFNIFFLSFVKYKKDNNCPLAVLAFTSCFCIRTQNMLRKKCFLSINWKFGNEICFAGIIQSKQSLYNILTPFCKGFDVFPASFLHKLNCAFLIKKKYRAWAIYHRFVLIYINCLVGTFKTHRIFVRFSFLYFFCPLVKPMCFIISGNTCFQNIFDKVWMHWNKVIGYKYLWILSLSIVQVN